MALSAGSRRGPYEIVAPLGAGGMGEVYRARDTKLNRDVAIKVLLPAVADDPERLARFRREAQVLASLNHPNIAQIYGLEETPSGDVTRPHSATRALVMELVEGPTLADRIAQGALPADEALPIARQIAEALSAAHAQGIIHRDLKPANVKVRPDGTVKVLDFGLAKAMEDGDRLRRLQTDVTQSPTITSPAMMTGIGVILGTAAYMAPEQARGKDVDRRADLWAFGCVFYEMLTGKRAFDGEDVSDTLANVLKTQPDWNALPADVPLAIRVLIQRCLIKDRSKRVADAATLAYVLDDAASLAAVTDAGTTPQTGAPRGAGRRRLLVIAAAAVLALSAGAAWSFRTPPPAPAITRFALSSFQGQLMMLGRNQITVSPDGTRLLYYSDRRLFLQDLAEFEPRVIPGTFGQVAFSPDGRSLAAWDATDSTIKRMAVGGSSAVTICPAGNAFGMTWDTSGIISGQGTGGILRCPVDGGMPEQLATVEEDEEAHGPQLLPGGEALLFTIARTAEGITRWDRARIVVQSMRTGERRTIVDGGSAGQYVSTGHLLYVRGGVVYAALFDADKANVIGAEVAVIDGVRRIGGGGTGAGQFTVSTTGHLFYIPGPADTATIERSIALADRAGVVTRLPIPPGPYVHTRASRDGTRLAVGSDDGKSATIWIYRLGATSALQQLTVGGRNEFPIWSPDGERVAFRSDRGGDQAIFAQRVDGTRAADRLTRAGTGEAHTPETWSPDGRHIIFSITKGSTYSLATLSLADGTVTPFGVTSEQPINAVFSPDGSWVAYNAGRSGSGAGAGTATTSVFGVFVQPFPTTGAVHAAPRVGLDFHPVWARGGKELIYVESVATGRLVSVAVTAGAGILFGTPSPFPPRVTANRISRQPRAHDILPDGQFVGLLEVSESEGAPGAAKQEIRVVLNWFEELKARVPATR